MASNMVSAKIDKLVFLKSKRQQKEIKLRDATLIMNDRKQRILNSAIKYKYLNGAQLIFYRKNKVSNIINILGRLIKVVTKTKGSGMGMEFFCRHTRLSILRTLFKKCLFGLNAGYFLRFAVVGYNYKLKAFKRRNLVMLKIGYFYKIIIKVPKLIKVRSKKRLFWVKGTNEIVFRYFVTFLRNLRNLYPYKKKGYALRNEKFKLKKGKKTRYR